MKARTPARQLARRLAKTIRKERPDHVYVKNVFEYIREELALGARPRSPKRLPELLTSSELSQFYKAVWRERDRTHAVMIKLLLFTGLRNAEVANLLLTDVDVDACTVRVQQGKGRKDRYVPFPQSFCGELNQYVANQRQKKARYLFETNRMDKFTTRWIRATVRRYADIAGIEKRIYPHLFRHQLLTFLAKKGIVDAKLQVLSGHGARKSLELYQELSLVDVADEYQDAMKDYPIK